MAHTPTIPPRIAAWLERFRTGAARAYRGQWYLREDDLRVKLLWDATETQSVECCPLTAQYTLDQRLQVPVSESDCYKAEVRFQSKLTACEVEAVTVAADHFALYEGFSPLECAIRTALLDAVQLNEEA